LRDGCGARSDGPFKKAEQRNALESFESRSYGSIESGASNRYSAARQLHLGCSNTTRRPSDRLRDSDPQYSRLRDCQSRLMTHPGVGPLSALATVLVLGTVSRFPTSKHVVSYVGLAPAIESSAEKTPAGPDHQTRQRPPPVRARPGGPSGDQARSGSEATLLRRAPSTWPFPCEDRRRAQALGPPLRAAPRPDRLPNVSPSSASGGAATGD